MYSLFLKILTYLLVTSLIVNQNSHKVSFNHQQIIPKIKHSWNNIRNTISSSISRISYHHTNNNVRVCILISLKIKNVKKIWEKSSENHRIKKYDFWSTTTIKSWYSKQIEYMLSKYPKRELGFVDCVIVLYIKIWD